MLGVLFEHPDWFVPLFAELDRRELPYLPIPADALRYDPAATSAPYSLVFNRMSPSAYLRGQILYRAAEMLEMRRAELQQEIERSNGASRSASSSETTLAIDRLVHYAGWTDKFSQIFGAVNPVASSHFNFSTPEPTGVVVVICPDAPALRGFISLMSASRSSPSAGSTAATSAS